MEIINYKKIEYARVLFSELNRDMRVDAEFHDPLHIRYEGILKQRKRAKVKSFAFVTDGIHESIDFDENSGINLISAKAPKENTFDISGTGYISEKQHGRNLRTSLRLNDVIISTVGTIGNCAVVEPDILPANSDRHVGIVRVTDESVLPRYLSTYFATKYGKAATRREIAGNVQPNLYIRNICDLAIPLPSQTFQQRIDKLVAEAHRQKQLAEKLYLNAENQLLTELGLLDWKPDTIKFTLGGKEFEVEDTAAEVPIFDVLTAERIDAEHYQPKFTNIINHVNNTGKSVELSSLLSLIQRGKQPLYAEAGMPVVNSKHVANGQVRINEENSYAISSKGMLQITHGDVLMNGTGVGTIGRCAPFLGKENALPDNHVTILRPIPGAIEPIYLAIFLNCIAGQFQVGKRLRGSSGQIELYPKDIARFRIWLAPANLQKLIKSQVEASFKAKDHSKVLLDQAKCAVELFIEEGGEAALQALANAEVVE